MSKIKITHIITGLNMGGAETMLYKLLKHIDSSKYDIQVISMMDDGVYGERIRSLGFEVFCLNMKQGRPTIKGIIQARKYLKNRDVIQTWMYHADFFGYLLYNISNAKKLVWGIRRNNLDSKVNKKSSMLVAKINSKLSKKVDVVVSCSIKAKETHVDFGYSDKNIVVIPNGFELNRFKKCLDDKIKLSSIVNQPIDTSYIVHVGRWNILKDHENLLNALQIIKKQNIGFHTILVGPEINGDNEGLMSLILKNDLVNHVTLLDRRDDIPKIMSGADIFVSSSYDEGFPNVVGEAMACETPCVVTDVGDSAYIVGNTGKVVPRKNSDKLARAIIELLALSDQERKNLGMNARQRVIEKFDIYKVTKQYEDIYEF